jgi:hypothetical protein
VILQIPSPFIDSPAAMADLPPAQHHHLNQSALLQLKKMVDQEVSLHSKIISLELCTLIAPDPPELPDRHFELKSILDRPHFDLASCEQEVLAQQIIHSETNTATLPPPVQVLCSKLVEIAQTSSDVIERNDFLLSLDLLSGNLKFTDGFIKFNNQFFQHRSTELNSLIYKTARSVQKVQKLRTSRPLRTSPKVKIEQDIARYGDTRRRLMEAKRRIAELTEKRNEAEGLTQLAVNLQLQLRRDRQRLESEREKPGVWRSW